MKLDLFEFETVLEGGDAPAPEPVAEAAEPVVHADPGDETPEVSEWSGPSRDEWETTQAELSRAREAMEYMQYQQQLPPAEQDEARGVVLPELDPYDPESVAAYQAALPDYIEQREQGLLAQVVGLLSPVLERQNLETAQQQAEQMFGQLNVPESELWRDGVLLTSAGFQQYDDQGRQLVPPAQAARASYEFLQKFSQAERAAAVEEYKAQQDKQSEALTARSQSLSIPAGPAGGEGVPQNLTERDAARMWLERERAAGNSGGF